jgi:hypothetical protein
VTCLLCGESVPVAETLDHMLLLHPDSPTL